MNKNTTFVPYPSLPHKITINWNLRCRHTTTVDPISYKLAYTGYTGQVTTDSTHPGPRMLRSYWTFASIYSVFPLQFNCFIRLDNLLELLFCSLCERQNVHDISDSTRNQPHEKKHGVHEEKEMSKAPLSS